MSARSIGTTALVTGANRGLGAALVDGLLAAGVGRVYAASRSGVAHRQDARIVPVALDITDDTAVGRAAAEHGDVDLLVNNAGIAYAQPFLGAEQPRAAQDEMRVNYFGTLAMCRAFAPVLARHGGGTLVNIVSIVGHMGSPKLASYAASKAAELSLTQALRGELGAQGTLVVGVYPGYIDTDMAAMVPAAAKVSPQLVVDSVIEALAARREDVFPGPAAAVAEALYRDVKAVEARFRTGL